MDRGQALDPRRANEVDGGRWSPVDEPTRWNQAKVGAHELGLPQGGHITFGQLAPVGRDFGMPDEYLALLCPGELARAQVEPQHFHLAGEADERAHAAHTQIPQVDVSGWTIACRIRDASR